MFLRRFDFFCVYKKGENNWVLSNIKLFNIINLVLFISIKKYIYYIN